VNEDDLRSIVIRENASQPIYLRDVAQVPSARACARAR
jgi:cobalt-zinc-cadmium resistance protein CzcA